MPQMLTVTDRLTPEDEKAVRDPLVAYNLARFGESDRRDLAVILRNDAGEAEGGLTGHTGRGWLYVQLLFIPEHRRGEGLAATLLSLAEDEARARGCVGAYIDTMNPVARSAYVKAGYRPLGELQYLEGGHSITWLCKRFDCKEESHERG
ncbi:GNAT superfamily N-acetyltransferase [Neorhizobium galegae]|uniref:GNAT family N-acetyltransferase n=1 Tax=Neorhizobium galegae TaxID=399 RepID=UPI001AEAE966|nr:GNAT family N-acetyltransferase [Neorhizobium galegae]MBP2548845.1 GNAT superfamily N-acetyltransferase [Neorhizobium galegae]